MTTEKTIDEIAAKVRTDIDKATVTLKSDVHFELETFVELIREKYD
jgi:hypothetical protein